MQRDYTNSPTRALSEEERQQVVCVRNGGLDFKELIDSLGSSRETSIAKTRVEEAVMWAVKHVTSEQTPAAEQPSMRRIFLDIFDRIAAALAAKSSGDTTALSAHVAEIDAHLQQVDSSDTDEQTRLTNIEAGLQKVADSVTPPDPAPDPTV
jgi:hypothetical protein